MSALQWKGKQRLSQGNGEFFWGGYGYECAFQKTDLALGAGVVKEPEAGASVHPHV